MQINSINKCPKPCVAFEGRLGTRLQRSLTCAERDLFKKASEQVLKLKSDINSMAYTKALDFRELLAKDAKAKLDIISNALNIIAGKN